MERFLTIYFDTLAASQKAIVGSLTCQSAQCSESPRLQALNQYQPTEAAWRTVSVLQDKVVKHFRTFGAFCGWKHRVQ